MVTFAVMVPLAFFTLEIDKVCRVGVIIAFLQLIPMIGADFCNGTGAETGI